MSVYRLLEEITKTLTPSKQVHQLLQQTIDEINKQLSLHNLDAKATLGGSVAKDTFLASDHDIDVFVRFAYEKYEHQDLSELLAQPMKAFSAARIHGSRDYFQFTQNNLDFEVVPVLHISSPTQAKNITDVSPLHVQYVQQSDVDTDQIRLLKQFMKANNLYGAESYIRGFSGHVVDLLVIEYQTFYKVLQAVTRWQAPVIIDTEKHHQNPLFAIEKSKHGPLILVDPIQPYRNAAAALEQEKLDDFISLAQAFIRSPNADYFISEEFDETQIRKEIQKYPAWVLLSVRHPSDDKKDVAGARVRKTYERVVDELTRFGFAPVESGWEFMYQHTSFLWFGFEDVSLDEIEIRQGPPITQEEHSQRFIQEHNDVYEQDGYLFARTQRSIVSAAQAITNAFEQVTAQTDLDYEIEAGVLREQDQ